MRMTRSPARRSTRPGMGRVVPAAEAPDVPQKPAKSGPPPSTTRRRQRISIREDHVGDVHVSEDAGALLRRTLPRVVLSPSQVAAAPLDHREGFLLAHVDSKTTVQALIDISGLPDDEVLASLQRLRRLGIITLG